jgi:Zn-dependent M16 (insulinase) family peptidase
MLTNMKSVSMRFKPHMLISLKNNIPCKQLIQNFISKYFILNPHRYTMTILNWHKLLKS